MSEKGVVIGEGHWDTVTEVRVVIMVVEDGLLNLWECTEFGSAKHSC